MNKEVNCNINIIKILAMLLIINLHVVNVSYGGTITDNITNLIYLIGVFGIPLFFMVNGYLLYGKDYNFQYIKSKILKIIIIIALWSAPTGLILYILKKTTVIPIIYFIDTFSGKGYFGQFWFLGALIIIYLFLFIFNRNIDKIINKKIIILLMIISMLVYILSTIMFFKGYGEIRDIIYPEFRLTTNLCYFIIGLYIKKNENIMLEKAKRYNSILYKSIVYGFILISFIYIASVSQIEKRYWASIYYDNTLIILSSILIFIRIMLIKIKENLQNYINKFVSYIFGIYALHPIIIQICNKTFLNAQSLIFFKYIVVLLISLLTTKCLLKFKATRYFVKY
jgi:surface polysaccharide O-acyltransferase-like enzyme